MTRMMRLLTVFFIHAVLDVRGFAPPQLRPGRAARAPSRRFADSGDDGGSAEARRLQQQAEALREQIRSLERQLNRDSSPPPGAAATVTATPAGPTLANKRVLVAGANGRLGSMVCRYLLRSNPRTEVVAVVHVVGENSPTARGYGRLSYEVGAEDGIGTIGPAWSAEDRTATFKFNPDTMGDYNLRNLRIVECELLDPIQCRSVCDETIDAVVWCATDFNGNLPRAVGSLNLAFLFRAVSRPTKGRVEVEGLQNMLEALTVAKQDRKRQQGSLLENDPTNFVLVSTDPDAYEDVETPFGSFLGIKRQGESLLQNFPSISWTVLQMSRYEDNFVEEGLELQRVIADGTGDEPEDTQKRRINRRDAARAVVDALIDPQLVRKTAKIWTAIR